MKTPSLVLSIKALSLLVLVSMMAGTAGAIFEDPEQAEDPQPQQAPQPVLDNNEDEEADAQFGLFLDYLIQPAYPGGPADEEEVSDNDSSTTETDSQGDSQADEEEEVSDGNSFTPDTDSQGDEEDDTSDGDPSTTNTDSQADEEFYPYGAFYPVDENDLSDQEETNNQFNDTDSQASAGSESDDELSNDATD